MKDEEELWLNTIADPEDAHIPVQNVGLPEQFEDLGVLASGAMGEVRRVRERGLDQVLAMKISTVQSDEDRERFQLEARAMAKLRHPSILAVHGQGTLTDGRQWFTTPEVVGNTLSHTIAEFHAKEHPNVEERFVRLLHNIADAADAVGFAHRHEVVHRDLKPDNIMIGVYGEVVVVDWGLSQLSLRVRSSTTEVSHTLTTNSRAGKVVGTPAYLPPEQAAADPDRDNKRCDVFCLGGCLFQLLFNRPPYPLPPTMAISAAQRATVLTPMPSAASTPSETKGLFELLQQTMHPDPLQRPQDGTEFAKHLRAAIHTRTCRVRGLALLKMAQSNAPQINENRRQARTLRARAAEHLKHLGPRAPTEKKAIGWELEDQAHAAELAASVAEARYLQLLQSALIEDEKLNEAHSLLAQFYRQRLQEMEHQTHNPDAGFYEVMLKSHDLNGQHQRWLLGQGSLCMPLPTEVTSELGRFESVKRRLTWVPLSTPHHGPINNHNLARGSYALKIQNTGFSSFIYPFSIARGRPWSQTPPGASKPKDLSVNVTLPENTCFVPGGWFTCGGDADAADALPARRIWVDDFVIQTFPVTFSDYLIFVSEAAQRGENPSELLPVDGIGVSDDPRPLLLLEPNNTCSLGTWGDGRPLSPDMPVVQITWIQAKQYSLWLARKTGLPWRLLHELEWEKAARGVDSRSYPWGEHLDPTWACMLQSHKELHRIESVNSYPTDVSPYGVRGMAGNVREWCLDDYNKEAPENNSRAVISEGAGEYRMIRGGSWSSAAHFCRVAGRFAAGPDQRLSSLGFRLGYSLKP